MTSVSNSGYTILETLIVMGITTAMFLIVASAFGGRQQQVEFAQAVRNFDSKLEDIKNDVATGYFPKNETARCRVVGNNPINRRPDYQTGGTIPDLGTNEECVSIGKVIQISPDISALGNSNENGQYIKVYNVSGLRTLSNGENPLNLIDARPTADPNPELILLEWGMKVTRVISSESTSVNDRGAIAIFSSLNRSSAIASSTSNEALQVNIIPGANFDMLEPPFTAQIDNLHNKIGPVSPGFVDFSTNPSITICVSDNDENRRAKIIIGSAQSGSIIEFDEIAECIP